MATGPKDGLRCRVEDWAIEFQIEADDAALNQLGFVTAIQKVHQISHGKAEKLWQGFLSQSENSSEQRMGLPIFWAICEAVARGDADAAECADLSLEEYLDGEMEGQYSEEEVQAARRIQAAQRGLNARAQADVTKAMASVSSPEQAAERIQAAFAGRLVREELLEAHFKWATAAEKIQAVYRGRQVRQEARQAGGLDRRSSQEAAAERIQAAFQGRIQREVFRVEDLTQEEASARIQAVYRGRQAREQAAASMGFRSRQEWPLPGADLFEEALAKQGGGGELLLQAGFLDMISKARAAPEISEFQAQALFEGTCVGTGQMGLSSKLFCELLQAIRLGDEAAAQFADMHIEDGRDGSRGFAFSGSQRPLIERQAMALALVSSWAGTTVLTLNDSLLSLRTSMPDSTSTMAARRNKVCLSTERLKQWEWLESKIRSKVQAPPAAHGPWPQRTWTDTVGHQRKSPFSMLSVEECVSMVSAQVLGPLGREEVALADALGRRLAEDGADAVVKVEDTVQSARSDGQVEVQILVSSRETQWGSAKGTDGTIA
eukprot:g6600.t1